MNAAEGSRWESHERLAFSANYSSWPFVDVTEPGDPGYGYESKIPEPLKQKLRGWARDFQENFDEETGLFPSQEHRARFDRQYIDLANELLALGIRFRLSLWW